MDRVTHDEARDLLARRLSERALAHCEAVAETSAVLARAYGADEDAARLAGLLHDWSREDDREGLPREAATLGIEVCDVDLRVPYLLHAKVGAAALKTALPALGDEVLRAVERHTTGSDDMTDLDMVVYIADMIEPRRDFAGVEHLRSLVGRVPLRELYTQSYQASLRHLVDARRPIHPDSVAAWNALVAEEPR